MSRSRAVIGLTCCNVRRCEGGEGGGEGGGGKGGGEGGGEVGGDGGGEGGGEGGSEGDRDRGGEAKGDDGSDSGGEGGGEGGGGANGDGPEGCRRPLGSGGGVHRCGATRGPLSPPPPRAAIRSTSRLWLASSYPPCTLPARPSLRAEVRRQSQ